MKFDKDGFPIDQEDLKRVATKFDMPVEEVEKAVRKVIKALSEKLKERGLDVPSDPQKEAEFIWEIYQKYK